MAKPVTFEGVTYDVPDDATDEEIFAFIESQAGGGEPTTYTGALLPFKTTTYPDGRKERELAVPGVVQGLIDTVIEGGEAARGMRDPEGPARDAALMVAGAGVAPKAAQTAAKAAAAGAEDVALTAKAIRTMPKVAEPLTAEQLKAAAKAAYKEAEAANVIIEPKSFSEFVGGLPNRIKDFHAALSPEVAPKASGVLRKLQEQAASGTPLSITELDAMRSVIGKAAATPDANEARLLGEIKDSIDDYLDGLSRADLPQFVDEAAAERGIAALKNARSNWHRSKKIEDIEFIVEAASSKEGVSDPRYVQNQFRNIRKNKKKYNRYTAEEKKIINKIAKTGWPEGLARILSPSGSMDITGGARLATGAAAGFLWGGPTGAVMVPSAAFAGRLGFDALRKKRVKDLEGLISRGTAAPSTVQRIRAQRAFLRSGGT